MTISTTYRPAIALVKLFVEELWSWREWGGYIVCCISFLPNSLVQVYFSPKVLDIAICIGVGSDDIAVMLYKTVGLGLFELV